MKVTEPCDSPACTTVDRWKFPKNKDCPRCKAAGEAVTRGKEGHGRHGREIRIRRSRQSSFETLPTPISPSGSLNLSVSPWAVSDRLREEKNWDTPTRRKADDAWLIEHERRLSDLEATASKLCIRDSHSPKRTLSTSSYERIIEADEVGEPEEIESLIRSQPASKLLVCEISHGSVDSRRSWHASRDSTPVVSSREIILTKPRSRTYHTVAAAAASGYAREPLQQQIIRKSRTTRAEFNYPRTCSYEYASPSNYRYSTTHDVHADRYEAAFQPFEQEYHPRTYPVY